MDLLAKERQQSQYQVEWRQDVAEAERHVRILAGMGEERLRWLRRVDDTVDAIATEHGLEIPYGIKGPEDRSRYNPAYRLELLAEQLKTRR